MSLTHVDPPNLPPPDYPYSHAARLGDVVYVSGQIPQHPSSPRFPDVVSDDFREQAVQVFANLEECLVAAGSSLGAIVKLNVFLADPRNFDVMNEVMIEMFPQPFPARTTVSVVLRGFQIEADCVAMAEREAPSRLPR